MVRVQTKQHDERVETKPKVAHKPTLNLLTNIVNLGLRVSFVLSLFVIAFLFNINLPDIPGGWQLAWGMLFSLVFLLLTILIVWIKQGYLKVYWGRFSLFYIITFTIFLAKYILDISLMSSNILDRLVITGIPLFTVLWALLIAYGVLIVFINLFKGDFLRFVQYLQGFALSLIALSAILVIVSVKFSNHIVHNGGIVNYLLKGVTISLNRAPVLPSILTLFLGGAGLATVLYLSFSIFWFTRYLDGLLKRNRILSMLISLFWLFLSFLSSLSSINIFIMWLIILGFVIIYLITKGFMAKNMASTKKIVGILFAILGIIIIGVGMLLVSKINVKFIITQDWKLFKLNLVALFNWSRLLKIATLLAHRMNIYGGWLKIFIFGFPLGMSSKIVQAASLTGLHLDNVAWLSYLLEFGFLAIIFMIAFVAYFVKFMLKLDSDTKVLIVLFPIIMYMLFTLPNPIGWVWFFTALGFLLGLVSNPEIATLGFYKLGSGSRKATSILYLSISIIFIWSVLELGHYYNIFRLYHAAMRKQNSVTYEFSDVLIDYANKLKNAKNNLGKDSLSSNEISLIKKNAISSLDSAKVNRLRQDISYLFRYEYRLNTMTQEAALVKVLKFNIDKQLVDLAFNYPQIYGMVLGVPNTEALDNYIASTYDLQQGAKLPIAYKLLGQAWQDLSRLQKAPIFLSRALSNYDKYIWFQPFDYNALRSYIRIIFMQYKAFNGKSKKTQADKTYIRNLESRIQVLLNLLNNSANETYKITGRLDPLLTAVSYRAEYFILKGDKASAEKSFDSLIKFVKSSKIKDSQKNEILKVIIRVKDQILNQTEQNKAVVK